MAQSNYNEDDTRAALGRDKLRTPPIFKPGTDGSAGVVMPGSGGLGIRVGGISPAQKKQKGKKGFAIPIAIKNRIGGQSGDTTQNLDDVSSWLSSISIVHEKGAKGDMMLGQYSHNETEAVIGKHEFQEGDNQSTFQHEVTYADGSDHNIFTDGGKMTYGGIHTHYLLFGKEVSDDGELLVEKGRASTGIMNIKGKGHDRYGNYTIAGYVLDGEAHIQRCRLKNENEELFEVGDLVYAHWKGTETDAYAGVDIKQIRPGFVSIRYLDFDLDPELSTARIQGRVPQEDVDALPWEEMGQPFRDIEETLFPRPQVDMRVHIGQVTGTIKEVHHSGEYSLAGWPAFDVVVLRDVYEDTVQYLYPIEAKPLRDEAWQIEWQHDVTMDAEEEKDSDSSADAEEEEDAEEEDDDGEDGIVKQLGNVTIGTTGNEEAAAREADPFKAKLIRKGCPDELLPVGKLVAEAAKKAVGEIEKRRFYSEDSEPLRDLVEVQMGVNAVVREHATVAGLSYLVGLCKVLGIKPLYKPTLDAEVEHMIATAKTGAEEDALLKVTNALKEAKKRIAELEAEKETEKEEENA